ncbi:MAG: glycosyltransferase family 4 protein [Clostridia bacterium]|nr:glycosyltransferase family 4 protein [Clostridia bacterium]
MKILFINHLPLVGSGSGVYISNLAKALYKLGHEICVIMPENETKNVELDEFKNYKLHPVYFKNEEKISGQLDFNFPCFTSHPRSSFNFFDMTDVQYKNYCKAFDEAIKTEIKNFKPDIIHSNHIWIISKIACQYNIPVVVTSHGTDIIGFQKGDRYRKDAEEVVQNVNKIIAVSNDNCKLIKSCFPNANPIVISAGYDSKKFNIQEFDKKELLEKYGIEYKQQKIVLYAGRLSYLKGVDVLLNAAKIYESQDDIITIIAGNGDLSKDLKKLAKNLDLKSVYFVGHKSQKALKKLYNIADVFAIPSRQEAFGLVGIEALACGLPVVASKAGGMSDYVNTHVGKLVNVEDEKDLSKSLLYVINNKAKYNKENLSLYAKENFEQEKMTNELLNIYNNAICKN